MKLSNRNEYRSHLLVVLALFAAGVCAGCAAPMQVFLHPEADLGYYSRVGVVPFRSLSADRLAGEKFTVEFNTALLNAELFDVVDSGVFLSDVTRVLGSRPGGELSAADLKKISENLEVQGVFVGTVSQFDMASTGAGRFPVITVEVRLLDAETGTVVWSATATEKGGPKMPLIGVGEIHTLGALSQKMSKKLVRKLK